MAEISKARSISDAQIEFVSLVDKAANKKPFLIAKAENGSAGFSSFGRIVKTDSESHYVTGVVYEPMIEDTQGDFMTEPEIQKAAVWFMKNGSGVDLQHNFKKFENAAVVESMVTKSDCEIGGEKIKKGTWLMTVEITDDDVWSAVEKGEITGFSMGGRGTYSEEDITLDEPEGLLKRLAKKLGFDVVEKGGFTDKYKKRNVETSFWDAFYTLQESLFRYDSYTGKNEPETDSEKIKECLAGFSAVIQDVLSTDAKLVAKSGKKLSGKNLEKLKNIYQSIGSLLEDADGMEENMTKSEVQEIIKAEIAKFSKSEGKTLEKAKTLDDDTKQLIVETVKEFLGDSKKKEESVTKEDVAEMVEKALEPIYKSRGIPTNLNSELDQVQKSSEHYLHGII